MSKKIFGWDPSDGFFSFWDNVADDYQLKQNETFISPLDQNGQLNPAVKWVNGTWAQPTAEDEAAYAAKMAKLYPATEASTPAGPSAEQQMINMLGKQQMEQSADIKQMKQMINLLGKQELNANKENGGN